MTTLIISFLYLPFITYALYFLLLIRGWHKGETAQPRKSPVNGFTVIIPCRNEAFAISTCLNSLLKQDYPSHLLEVIVVDDYSGDNTVRICKSFHDLFQRSGAVFQLITADKLSGNGKKNAIKAAVSIARYEWIITTDADTVRNTQWLKYIDAFIEDKDPVMVSAPVSYVQGASSFTRWQAVEFAGLTATGGAALNMGAPNMCNGANLAFRKSIFYESGGYERVINIASGDDEFLLHKFFKAYPGRIRFLKEKEAMVYTYPEPELKGFLMQRLRWASKGRFYTNPFSLLPALSVWFIHCLLLIVTLGWIIGEIDLPRVVLSLWMLKTVPEFLFLLLILPFYGLLREWYLYWISQPFYVLYVIITGLLGTAGNFKWKGRTIKKGRIAISER